MTASLSRVAETQNPEKLGSRQFRAGIFSMDGVLLDSEPFHHRAINDILSTEDRAGLSREEYSRYLGMTNESIWRDLVRRYRLPRTASY
jgi:beta-phosphoglucomutase-like phosphatase (HAD superfamily)